MPDEQVSTGEGRVAGRAGQADVVIHHDVLVGGGGGGLRILYLLPIADLLRVVPDVVMVLVNKAAGLQIDRVRR